jgi:tetratricopeptide (TPR) repeat protein
MARDSREHLWAFLDVLDARPGLKKALQVGLPSLLLVAGLAFWGYRHWSQTNSLRIARQWLNAGRLDRAAAAVQSALEVKPELPESWALASELAWRKGNHAVAVGYARKAAVVSSYRPDEVIAWAEASILSDDVDQAQEALGFLNSTTAHGSPRALRVSGELARRSGQFAVARDDFQAALAADRAAGVQDVAADEVPLGIVCLQTGSSDDRGRGQSLLGRWAPDDRWGVAALRALLADAQAHVDRKATAHWAGDLRGHPRCTLGDIPTCLRALSDSDPSSFGDMLAQLEAKGRSNPAQAAQLMGWLTEAGQGDEAIRWSGSLDPNGVRRPPVALGVAEALRTRSRWPELKTWVERCEWGTELGFIGWAYGFVASRQLGDEGGALSYWNSLSAHARLSPAHALFAGDSLYAWGYPKEASELLWIAAERPDQSYMALGTLARLYQVQRDALGQYKAFSRLNGLRPADRNIANNFAYFGALTDQGSQERIRRLAEENFSHEPGSLAYRATYAFVLVWSGQASRAMALLEPVAHDWRKSPAVAFAYGATLANLGRKSEAKEVLDSLDPRGMSIQEADWIRTALQ